MVTEKYCSDCGFTFSADNFYVKKGTWISKKTGIEHSYTYLRPKCKFCHGKEVKENQVLNERRYMVNSIKKEQARI